MQARLTDPMTARMCYLPAHQSHGMNDSLTLSRAASLIAERKSIIELMKWIESFYNLETEAAHWFVHLL